LFWLVPNYRVGQTQLGSFLSLIINQSNNTRENGKVPFGSCHLSTTKGTFQFSRVLLDWLVINDQKLPNWVWPNLYKFSVFLRSLTRFPLREQLFLRDSPRSHTSEGHFPNSTDILERSVHIYWFRRKLRGDWNRLMLVALQRRTFLWTLSHRCNN
jgi:hypothetical protein